MGFTMSKKIAPIKKFVYEVLVDSENLCNLKSQIDWLEKEISAGQRIVIYGRRNTGKTSLLRNVIIPSFRKNNKNAVILFADLMGVQEYKDILQRIRIAFEEAVSQTYPTQTYVKSLAKTFGKLRPTLTANPTTGEIRISLGVSSDSNEVDLEVIMKELSNLHNKGRCLFVLDEFQDITEVKSSQARLRNALQQLPSDLPVVVLGSKKHLLSRIFAFPKAPLASWGKDLEIPTLEDLEYQETYLSYVNERFSYRDLYLEKKDLSFLLNLAQNIPECANIICDTIFRVRRESGRITEKDIRDAFVDSIEVRRGRFEERLKLYRETERTLLVAIAKHEPVSMPKGKGFLSYVPSLSPSTVFNLIHQLDNEAEIYLTKQGYMIADPFLAEYLRRYR